MHRSTSEAGFSLVEVIVALVVMTVVAVSLSGTTQFTARLTGRSEIELQAAQYLEAEVERLRAVPYDALENGADSAGLGTSSWQVIDSATFRQILLETRFGHSVDEMLIDSVTVLRRR